MARRTLVTLLAVLGVAAGCHAPDDFDEADYKAVDQVLEDYRAAWLANDSARVLAHVSDSVIHYVPGATNSAILGKAALREFWFPSSNRSYPIRVYQISGQRIHAAGEFAIVEGRSELAWDTVEGDSVISSSRSTSDFLTILRKESGVWRLFRQMYQTRE